MVFDIKNTILAGLRKNQFDGNGIRHPCEHISHFYETCTMCRPDGVTNGQIKLRLFNLTLTRREKYWLQFLSNGTFHTWKELEDNFLNVFILIPNSWKEGLKFLVLRYVTQNLFMMLEIC